MVNTTAVTLAETQSVEAAVAQGFAVMRRDCFFEELDFDHLAKKTCDMRDGFRKWCRTNKVPALQFSKWGVDRDWSVGVFLPKGSTLQDAIIEVIERHSEVADYDRDMGLVSTAGVTDQNITALAHELVALIGLPVRP